MRSQCICNAHRDLLIHVHPFPAVLRCRTSFFWNVRCTWSIHVASMFGSVASLSFLGTCNSAGWSTCHLCSAVFGGFPSFVVLIVAGQFTCHLCSAVLLSFPVFTLITVIDWFIHVSSVLNSYFLAETCEVLEDSLDKFEAELKVLREESCWIFQFRCSWTCSLLLLASLIVAVLSVSWCCVRSCIRRANVVVDSDGSQERSGPCRPWWDGAMSWILWEKKMGHESVVAALWTHYGARGGP